MLKLGNRKLQLREAYDCKKDRENESSISDAEDITATAAAAITFTGEQVVIDLIPKETIWNYIQRSRNYMCAYLGGKTPGTEMEKAVKKFSKDYKSHRRVGINRFSIIMS